MKIRNGKIEILKDDCSLERTSILLAGDFCPINRTGKAVLAGRTEEMVESMAPLLERANVSILNLEAPLTLSTTGIRKTGPNLRGDPGCVEFFERAGFDVANLANNHIKDMGSEAVLETMQILEENHVSTVGAGRNSEEASCPLIIEKGEAKIAILAYAENEFSIADEVSAGAAGLDLIPNLEQTRQVSSDTDVTIVLIHGGNEYCPVPSPRMRQWYRAFARAGASAVVATHTHCPQGVEIVDGVPIVYSMGNFLFDTPYEDREHSGEDFWWKGYLVKLDLAGSRVASVDLIPYSSGPDGAAVRLLEGHEREDFQSYLQHISDLIQEDTKLRDLWHAWCLKQGPFWMEYFRKAQYPDTGGDAFEDTMILRNGFTCEAHNEVIRTFLRMICEGRIGEAEKFVSELEALQKGHF